MAAGQTYEQIAWTSLGAPAASITFSSIAASWTDLQLVIVPFTASSTTSPVMTFNNDTATNYSIRSLYGNRTTVGGGSAQTQANIAFNNVVGSVQTTPTLYIADIMQYKNTTPYKTVIIQNANDISASGSVIVSCGMWRSTSAINRIDVTASGGVAQFATGTTFALYGIAAA